MVAPQLVTSETMLVRAEAPLVTTAQP
jgi:hypothetical protein